MDLQLHPLRDSTWIEIFPVLGVFSTNRNQTLNSQGPYSYQGRGSTKAHEFMKNEAMI